MRIVYHLGAHFTDEERLLRCLLKNRGLLAQNSVAVPGPKSYRQLLRDTILSLKGQAASEDTQTAILDQILDNDHAERLVLSWDGFLSLAPWVLKNGLYEAAGTRVRAFTQLFPTYESEFHLGMRNPASFLPALYSHLKSPPIGEFLAGIDPFDLYWSDVVERILDQNPDVKLTLWCDEDTPLIWPEILRAVSGLPGDQPMEGETDLLSQLMSGEGLTRLNAYLLSHPPANVAQRRKIVSAFLDKFALPDRIEYKFEMPGWSASMVEEMTQAYDEDIARIMAMSEVTFLSA